MLNFGGVKKTLQIILVSWLSCECRAKQFMSTRFFQVTPCSGKWPLDHPKWRSLNPWKCHFTPPQKGHWEELAHILRTEFVTVLGRACSEFSCDEIAEENYFFVTGQRWCFGIPESSSPPLEPSTDSTDLPPWEPGVPSSNSSPGLKGETASFRIRLFLVRFGGDFKSSIIESCWIVPGPSSSHIVVTTSIFIYFNSCFWFP